jgi:hypothetical protein
MIFENNPVLGYVFIIAGIAFAIIAYVIYLNLREDNHKNLSGATGKDAGFHSSLPLTASETGNSLHEITSNAVIPDSEPLEKVEKMEKDFPVETPSPAKKLPKETPMPEKQEIRPVATILRETDTGKLIVHVDDAEYINVDELKTSPHWARIERLVLDLWDWVQPQRSPQSYLKTPVREAAKTEKELLSAKSMVEEINQILERNLQSLGDDQKAVKIVGGLDGAVIVYVGVETYPIDEVPYEEVRQLIRQAVAEWEQNR